MGLKTYIKSVGIIGLFYAILAKATNSKFLYKMVRKDCLHPFWLRVPSSDVGVYKQVFKDKEYRFCVKEQPRVIIDAGANIGLASIYFANKYSDAKIIALEPEQNNFQLLSRNTASYGHIIPVQDALWHRNEEISLINAGLGNWGFFTAPKTQSKYKKTHVYETVTGKTVDRIMQEYNLETIDILKIDIEGAEREVFSDSKSWIEKVGLLIVELHERMKSGCNRSFYCNTDGFDKEWLQGELVFLSRRNNFGPTEK